MPYFFIVGLQIICILHWIKYKPDGWWIFLIIFLPGIGSLIYLFSNILTGKEIEMASQSLVSIVNPSGKIVRLEKAFQFSDTFENKIALADAYQEAEFYDQSIELYESSLTGVFDDNKHVIHQLITAYWELEQYEKVCSIVNEKVKENQFFRNQDRFLYAKSLEKLGQLDEAETALKALNIRYSNLEMRVYYGQFLIKKQERDLAAEIFEEILEEANHLEPRDRRKRENNIWIEAAKESLAELG